MALRHRDHPDDLAHARRQRHLQALGVGDEHLDAQTLRQPRAPQDLARIGQLRDRLGRHERADLQALEAAGGQLLDEGDLGLGRDERLDGLEAVARRHLENFDLAHGPHPCLHGLIPTRKYRQRQEEMAGCAGLMAPLPGWRGTAGSDRQRATCIRSLHCAPNWRNKGASALCTGCASSALACTNGPREQP